MRVNIFMRDCRSTASLSPPHLQNICDTLKTNGAIVISFREGWQFYLWRGKWRGKWRRSGSPSACGGERERRQFLFIALEIKQERKSCYHTEIIGRKHKLSQCREKNPTYDNLAIYRPNSFYCAFSWEVYFSLAASFLFFLGGSVGTGCQCWFLWFTRCKGRKL